MEQPKIERMLHFITLLADKKGYTIDEIAQRLEISRRSAYRYIDTFKDARFIIDNENGRYRLATNKGSMKELADTIWFTEEEAYLIKRLIDELDNSNGMKAGLIRKLAAISSMTNLGDYTQNKSISANINNLASAIRGQKQVLIKNYSSAHSDTRNDHMVEPFEFTTNMIDVWAFDLTDRKNKRFKIARIESIQILNNNWQYKSLHKSEPIDDFRTHGNETHQIKLILDRMAKDLLTEEFPLSERHITTIDDCHWIYEAEIHKIEGAGRFVIGLYPHITILEGNELEKYIKDLAKKSLIDKKPLTSDTN